MRPVLARHRLIDRRVRVGLTEAESDALYKRWEAEAEKEAADRAAKEEDLRQKTKSWTEWAGPYGKAAQGLLEVAIIISNLFSKDLNSKEQQDRAMDAIRTIIGLGLVPPTWTQDAQTVSGYAEQLEDIIRRAQSDPSLLHFGKLFYKFAATDPIVQTIGNDAAKAFGFFGGGVTSEGHPDHYELLYPQRPVLIAQLVGLERGVDPAALLPHVLANWTNFPERHKDLMSTDNADFGSVDAYTLAISEGFQTAEAWAAELEPKKSFGGGGGGVAVVAVAGVAGFAAIKLLPNLLKGFG